MAAEFCPDVVLMDIAMPVLNGIEATRRILRQCPRTRIVGVSIYDTSGMEEVMRAAGAVAYVAKGPELDELVETVQSVAESRTEDSLIVGNQNSDRSHWDRITDRDFRPRRLW